MDFFTSSRMSNVISSRQWLIQLLDKSVSDDWLSYRFEAVTLPLNVYSTPVHINRMKWKGNVHDVLIFPEISKWTVNTAIIPVFVSTYTSMVQLQLLWPALRWYMAPSVLFLQTFFPYNNIWSLFNPTIEIRRNFYATSNPLYNSFIKPTFPAVTMKG